MFMQLKSLLYNGLILILILLLLFSHLDISGKNDKDMHSSNISFIFFRFEVSHYEISGKKVNEKQL